MKRQRIPEREPVVAGRKATTADLPPAANTWTRLALGKAQDGRRAVPALIRTVDALKWHRTRQDAEKITAGSASA